MRDKYRIRLQLRALFCCGLGTPCSSTESQLAVLVSVVEVSVTSQFENSFGMISVYLCYDESQVSDYQLTFEDSYTMSEFSF